MKKFTKQLLTGVFALGLLAPAATSALVNNPVVTVSAKRHYKRHNIYSWNYIDHYFYRASNAFVMPKAFSGQWVKFSGTYKYGLNFPSHHSSYKSLAKDVNSGSTRSKLTARINLEKKHHINFNNLVERVGHNRYVLNFNATDGPYYNIKKASKSHPITKVHILNHKTAYFRDYRHGHLIRTDSGIYHRVSLYEYQKLGL